MFKVSVKSFFHAQNICPSVSRDNRIIFSLRKAYNFRGIQKRTIDSITMVKACMKKTASYQLMMKAIFFASSFFQSLRNTAVGASSHLNEIRDFFSHREKAGEGFEPPRDRSLPNGCRFNCSLGTSIALPLGYPAIKEYMQSSSFKTFRIQK